MCDADYKPVVVKAILLTLSLSCISFVLLLCNKVFVVRLMFLCLDIFSTLTSKTDVDILYDYFFYANFSYAARSYE